MAYTDNTILTFGEHKFTALCRVPAQYLLNLYKNKNKHPDKDLMEYIEKNMDTLKSKLEGKTSYPEMDIDFRLSGRSGNNIKLVCKHTDKIIYATQNEAKNEIKRIQNIEQKNKKKPTREYECEKCGGWHTTSMPLETYEEKNKTMKEISVTIQEHDGMDKFFDMTIGDGELRMEVDYDDVDHATVDAMAETVAEIIRKNWDSELFEQKQREHQRKRWDKDEHLRAEYASFDEFYKEVKREL